jgi:hypothetical protein
LDLTAKQVVKMREDYGFKVKFMLMNSFSTSDDTLAFLKSKYPELAAEEGIEMMQNKVPKLDATTFQVSLSRQKLLSMVIHDVLTLSLLLSLSLLSVKATRTTNGVPLDMATCTRPW